MKLPLVDNPVCQSNLREYTALSDSFELHDSFMCAGGGEGVDTCTGDGGGPLMCPSAEDPNRWIQVQLLQRILRLLKVYLHWRTT